MSIFFLNDSLKNKITRSCFLFLAIVALTITSNCQSSPEVEEEVVDEIAKEEENLSVKKRSMPLPESGCCPVNRSFADIVVLDKICFSPTKTELVLHLTEQKRVCVIRENTVFEDNTGRKYRLLSTKGVDYCPKRRSMVNTPFSVYFDKLDSQAISFNYLESSASDYATNPWEFYDVDLTQCNASPTPENPIE